MQWGSRAAYMWKLVSLRDMICSCCWDKYVVFSHAPVWGWANEVPTNDQSEGILEVWKNLIGRVLLWPSHFSTCVFFVPSRSNFVSSCPTKFLSLLFVLFKATGSNLRSMWLCFVWACCGRGMWFAVRRHEKKSFTKRETYKTLQNTCRYLQQHLWCFECYFSTLWVLSLITPSDLISPWKGRKP